MTPRRNGQADARVRAAGTVAPRLGRLWIPSLRRDQQIARRTQRSRAGSAAACGIARQSCVSSPAPSSRPRSTRTIVPAGIAATCSYRQASADPSSSTDDDARSRPLDTTHRRRENGARDRPCRRWSGIGSRRARARSSAQAPGPGYASESPRSLRSRAPRSRASRRSSAPRTRRQPHLAAKPSRVRPSRRRHIRRTRAVKGAYTPDARRQINRSDPSASAAQHDSDEGPGRLLRSENPGLNRLVSSEALSRIGSCTTRVARRFFSSRLTAGEGPKRAPSIWRTRARSTTCTPPRSRSSWRGGSTLPAIVNRAEDRNRSISTA